MMKGGLTVAKKRKMKTAPQMVVTSRVKEVFKGQKMRAAGELVGAVNEVLFGMLREAASRAKANSRSTVRAHDL
jgi:hypothetical protein